VSGARHNHQSSGGLQFGERDARSASQVRLDVPFRSEQHMPVRDIEYPNRNIILANPRHPIAVRDERYPPTL